MRIILRLSVRLLPLHGSLPALLAISRLLIARLLICLLRRLLCAAVAWLCAAVCCCRWILAGLSCVVAPCAVLVCLSCVCPLLLPSRLLCGCLAVAGLGLVVVLRDLALAVLRLVLIALSGVALLRGGHDAQTSVAESRGKSNLRLFSIRSAADCSKTLNREESLTMPQPRMQLGFVISWLEGWSWQS